MRERDVHVLYIYISLRKNKTLYQENLNVQFLNDFLVLKELLPTLVKLNNIIYIYLTE